MVQEWFGGQWTKRVVGMGSLQILVALSTLAALALKKIENKNNFETEMMAALSKTPSTRNDKIQTLAISNFSQLWIKNLLKPS